MGNSKIIFLLLFAAVWLVWPAGPDSSGEKAPAEKQFSAAGQTLIDFGLIGHGSQAGFVVDKVKEKSLAEKAGFKPGDTISLIDTEPVNGPDALLNGLKKHRETVRTSSIMVTGPDGVREIAWPPFQEDTGEETGLKEAALNHALGTRALAEQDYGRAAGFLQSSIMASINYRDRALVFQELVECYLAVIKEIGERETKTYTLPLVSSLNLEQVRQRLAYLQQTAEMVRRYQEIVRIYLRHVELEKMRAGAPQTHCELQEKTEELRQELKRLVSAYEESFRPYQSALLARIDLLDFPRWLKGEIEVVWELFDRKSGVRRSATYLLEQTTISTRARMRETSQPILEVRFAPVATVVLTNSSRQYPFSGKVEVQYRDSTGSLRGQVSQEVSLASGEKKELLIESPKRFQGSEVVGTNVFRDNLSVEQLTQNLRKWQAELFLNGKSYGRVTIRF